MTLLEKLKEDGVKRDEKIKINGGFYIIDMSIEEIENTEFSSDVFNREYACKEDGMYICYPLADPLWEPPKH